MYFKSRSRQISEAVAAFDKHKNNLSSTGSEPYKFWKPTALELMKKYLGPEHEYVKELINFDLTNSVQDPVQRRITAVLLHSDAERFMKKSIEWVKEHGVKREPLLELIAEKKDLVGAIFTIGVLTGAFIQPIWEKWTSDVPPVSTEMKLNDNGIDSSKFIHSPPYNSTDSIHPPKANSANK